MPRENPVVNDCEPRAEPVCTARMSVDFEGARAAFVRRVREAHNRRSTSRPTRMPVSEKEQQQINSLVARFEAATGIQAVAAVVAKADAYPEIPWKAYAIG